MDREGWGNDNPSTAYGCHARSQTICLYNQCGALATVHWMSNKLGCNITTEHWPLSTAWATNWVVTLPLSIGHCPLHGQHTHTHCNCDMHVQEKLQLSNACEATPCPLFQWQLCVQTKNCQCHYPKNEISKTVHKTMATFFTFKHSVPCLCCKCPSHIYLWLRPPTMESLSLSAPSLSKFSAWMALAMVLMTCWWSLACASVTCTINLNLQLANFSCR